MELKNCINEVFKDYCEDYKCLLYDFRPWAEEHSIHETNQVSNFISTYRKKREKSIACLEFSIPYNNAEGVKKRDSVDGLIVDADTIIFIEAKRFSRGKKIRDLEEDLKRIKVLAEDEVCRKKIKDRLPKKDAAYNCFCLLLADFWADHNSGIPCKYKEKNNLNWDAIWGGYNATLSGSGYSSDKNINIKVHENYYLAYALFKLKDF